MAKALEPPKRAADGAAQTDDAQQCDSDELVITVHVTKIHGSLQRCVGQAEVIVGNPACASGSGEIIGLPISMSAASHQLLAL